MKESGARPWTGQSDLIKLFDAYMRATRPAHRRRLELEIGGHLVGGTLLSPSDVIAAAVQRMPEGRYRSAGFTLLVDPELAGANLTERSSKAAGLFGQAPETFRRKDGGRPQIIDELADQIVAMTREHEERHSSSASEPDLAVSTEQPTRGPRRRGFVAAIVGVCMAAAIGLTVKAPEWLSEPPTSGDDLAGSPLLEGEVDVTLHCQAEHGARWTATPEPATDTGWLCLGPNGENPMPADLNAACVAQYGDSAKARNGGGSAAGWTCVVSPTSEISDGSCVAAAGAFDPSLAEEFAPFAGPFRQRYDEAGGQEVLGCPATVMHRWSSGVMQELGTDLDSTAGLLAHDSGPVVLLEGASWKAFDRIKGVSGTFVGYPENEPHLSDDNIWMVDLAPGGALVAQKEDGPYFWLPPFVLQYWLRLGGQEGCLGFPLTDPFSDGSVFRQDFELGQVIVDPGSASVTAEGDQC